VRGATFTAGKQKKQLSLQRQKINLGYSGVAHPLRCLWAGVGWVSSANGVIVLFFS